MTRRGRGSRARRDARRAWSRSGLRCAACGRMPLSARRIPGTNLWVCPACWIQQERLPRPVIALAVGASLTVQWAHETGHTMARPDDLVAEGFAVIGVHPWYGSVLMGRA